MRAEPPIAAEILDHEQRGMTARNHQREVRHRDPMLEQRREQMALDMIDADERKTGRLREALRAHQADQQRADQSRPARDRDAVDIARACIRAVASARSITGMIVTTWLRDASSGTIPPYSAMDVVLIGDRAGADLGDCPARSVSKTAAAASSHEDSIPRISIEFFSTLAAGADARTATSVRQARMVSRRRSADRHRRRAPGAVDRFTDGGELRSARRRRRRPVHAGAVRRRGG